MLELEVFIIQLFTIDRMATTTNSMGKISSLDHDILDHTMKLREFVTIWLPTLSQSIKVLSGLGNSLAIAKESDFDISNCLSINVNRKFDCVSKQP